MRNMMLGLACAALLAGAVPSARAGALVKQEMRKSATGKVIGTVVMYLDDGRLRISTKQGKADMDMIFDAARKTIWMVDHRKKRIQVMDEEFFRKMQKQMEEAMKALENMPPAMREMMEGKMGGEPLELVPGARGQKVGRFTCRLYTVLAAGSPSMEMCNAPLAALNVRRSELETFRAMAEMMGPLSETVDDNASWAPFSGKMMGFPVRTVILKNGVPDKEHIVVEAIRQEFGDDVFALPAGYKKKKM